MSVISVVPHFTLAPASSNSLSTIEACMEKIKGTLLRRRVPLGTEIETIGFERTPVTEISTFIVFCETALPTKRPVLKLEKLIKVETK